METREKKDTRKPASSKRKVTSKQVVAIIGIVLLVLMYVATLIAAFFDTTVSGRLFWMCLFSTMAVPILIWIYTWMYGKLTGRHTFADFETGTEGWNAETDSPAEITEKKSGTDSSDS